MGERKVLNKYIPYDFDPKLVPRGKRPKDDLIPVRMMLPFSIQCSTCSSFMYRGRKFNSKKEAMKGPSGKYLSIQRFRFYIKCTVCSRPITFLTDPKNSGSTHLSPIVRRSLSPAPPHESPSPACATTHDPRKWLPGIKKLCHAYCDRGIAKRVFGKNKILYHYILHQGDSLGCTL